ncbi:MAG: penicillin-binding protein, partial [Thermoanaerobaculia bacterium]|nr:penicillin-binding protein [Thermoanaerobaculia bacterium]
MKHGRLLFVLGFAAAWMGGVVWRLWDLQIREHESYVRRAVRQQQQVLELDPPRGTIYDARGRALAVSVADESPNAVPR